MSVYNKLATRMAHGNIREFDPTKESIEDFQQCFEFYCLANNIKTEDEAQIARKKAVFVTMLGQATFAKLRDLANPRAITDLTLADIMDVLTAHYRPHTIEIAERYKFFKCVQEDGERVADFVANLRRLAKTCNFGQYLNTALRDQLVCGLRDHKCQRDLLSISDLTLAVVLQKATTAETADKGTKHIRADITTSDQPLSQELHKMAAQTKPCYRCGRSGHQPAHCKFRNATCYSCQKVGHLASVCKGKKSPRKADGSLSKTVKALQEQDNGSSSDSSGCMHTILQLGTKASKFLITVAINSVPIEMEVDSGAEQSTVPLSTFTHKLKNVCKLKPSTVSLYQYDKSPLKVSNARHTLRSMIVLSQQRLWWLMSRSSFRC